MDEPLRPFGASAEAIRLHYDVGNEFYALWLDESMSYSCALWDGEVDSLADAQVRKTDYLLGQTRAQGKSRLLDVGCGWGPLLQRATRHHGVGKAVGLTLSPEQAAWIRASENPRVEVRLENWQEHVPEAPYDAIVIVGALEHFARREDSDEQKIVVYQSFLEKAHEWLAPGGWLCIQAICYGTMKREDFNSFIAREIFPEADLPRLSELCRASEGLFELIAVTNDRLGYRRTCDTWLQRLQASREQAVALVGEETTQRFETYLGLCVRIFQSGACVLHRVTLRRLNPS